MNPRRGVCLAVLLALAGCEGPAEPRGPQVQPDRRTPQDLQLTTGDSWACGVVERSAGTRYASAVVPAYVVNSGYRVRIVLRWATG
jgi:hypothetical protein